MRTSGRVVIALAVALTMLRADLARAQSNEELQREVEELKRTVQALEQQNEQLQGLDQQVKIIDRKLEIQQDAELEASKVRPVLELVPRVFPQVRRRRQNLQSESGWMVAGG